MSYILEALRKAERERNAAQAAAPRIEPAARLARTPLLQRLRQYRPVLVAGLCLGLMIALAMTLLRHHRNAPVAAATEALPTAAAAPEAAASAQPEPVKVPPGSDLALTTLDQIYADGDGPATLDDLVDEGSDAGNAAPAPAAADTAEPPPPPEPVEAAPTLQASAVNMAAGSAAPEPPPTPVAPVTRASTPPAVERVKLEPAPVVQVPKLGDMPSDYRAAFPKISLDVHSYDTAAKKRFIMVGGKRYNEGDSLPEGPRIVQIVPDGVIFDFRGEQSLFPLVR